MVTLKWGWYGTEMTAEPVDTADKLYGEQIPVVDPAKYRDLAFLNEGEPILSSMTLSHAQNAQRLTELAEEFPFSSEFIRLMTSKELQEKIPSATGAYFKLGEPIYVEDVDTTVLLFYSDQQGCILWYLVLDGPYEGHVLASMNQLDALDEDEDVQSFWEDQVYVSASSFAEFIHRAWLENQIWFKLNDHVALSSYVDRECDWYEGENAKLGRTCR